jgi:MFS family permease
MATTSAPRRVPLAVTALCLVQFMDALGVTVVVTALPSMLTSLHASQAYSTLVATRLRDVLRRAADAGCAARRPVWPPPDDLASLAVFAQGWAMTAAPPRWSS